MYCKDCLDAQSSALRQVESLLSRLESAESLFPSNKAFGAQFPLYKSEEFVNRVKCMCLWYNMTRHHRLKLIILGKLLAKLQGKEYKWPLVESDSSSGASSIQEPEIEGNGSTGENSKSCEKNSKVQFLGLDETDQTSTTDSANSEESTKNGDSGYYNPIGEYGRMLSTLNPWKGSVEDVHKKFPSSPYRKFIENVLKSRGLGKSLVFLHRLHNVVLRKAHITLEKPGTSDEQESEQFDEEEIPDIEPPMDKEESAELRRYGVWSAEFKELALPTYISAFLFLSLIPLEVVQEFLKMKLETKPVQPNPLSLEQLIKELKEGVTLALIHRDRFHKHITSALVDRDNDMEVYMQIIDEFDVALKKIFELYLEYVTQWILTGVPESHRKSALETEWKFTKLVCPMIHDEHSVAAQKFCTIIESLLNEIGSRLTSKTDELERMKFEESIKSVQKDEVLTKSDGNSLDEEEDPSTIFKNKLLAMCREIQQLFTDEREKCMKLMLFTKCFLKDIEKDDFHREHNCLSDNTVCLRHSTSMCTEVLEAINGLKSKTLELREKLTTTLQRVQERSDVKHLMDMHEIDRQTVLTRCKEILHVGYKFGFEYHKDLSKLFETVSSPTRNSKVERGLAKAIVGFAKCWMNFVMERCERGRGLRPRWAATGLDFLIIACDPHNTEQIDDKEFEELKSLMDRCISHVIGSIYEPERVRKSPRSRKSSPAPTRKRTPTRQSISYTPTAQRVLQHQMSIQVEKSRLTPSPDFRDHPDFMRKQTSCENVADISIKVPQGFNSSPELRQVRIRDAVNRLDFQLEKNLREKNLIGYVKELNACDKVVIRARSVNFSWHRGIKIGQGRFGKVYTAVNNSTVELMAMKEIPIQAGETGTIKRVAEELKIFEGISHKHLVKYYGVEIHRVSQ